VYLGLDDLGRVAARAEGEPTTAEFTRGVIAHLEDRAVGCFERTLRWADRDKKEKLIGDLTRIRRASLAPTLMEMQARRNCAAAQHWLDTYPQMALEGCGSRPHN